MAISDIQASGGDYTTITAWESATDNDLVTAGDSEIGRINDSGNYNESVIISGATTDASNYRKLTVSDGNWHEGTYSTSKARMIGNPSGRQIAIDEDYFWIDRLIISHAGQSPGNSEEAIRVEADTVGTLVTRCILRGDGNVQDCDAFYVNGAASATGSATLSNNLIYDWGRSGINIQFWAGGHDSSNFDLNADHNTIDNVNLNSSSLGGGIVVYCAGGTASGTVDMTLYNNVVTGVSGSVTNYETHNSGTYTISWAGTHNASDDGSATEGSMTNAQNNLTRADIYTNPDGDDDYTPAAGEGLEDNGTDRQGNEADSRADYSIDLGGEARGTTGVEIGCFVIAAAGGGSIAPLARHHMQQMGC